MLYIITREGCPYCAAAKENISRIIMEHPGLQIMYLEETQAIMEQYDYYYTPAYFWDKEKLAEGSYSEEGVAEIISRANKLSRADTE